MEKWKKVGESANYEVSSEGQVRTTKTGVIHIGSRGNSGYNQVNLKGDIQRTCMIHRMVAEAFLPNPECKPQVNHKNGIKTDNCLKNLEWATREENMQHCYDTGLKTYQPLHYKGKFGAEHNRSIAIEQVSETGEVLARFGSMWEAQRMTGVRNNCISWACKHGGINRATKTFFRVSKSLGMS